ncbi:protein phosphatase 2C domain-containing protein [Sphingomonas sp. HF-S4]|uniref:Protein phosphatase 2C domain-containing protein n=1 Tax=Sphingomonas agrestis TaxID=3080540 RepID=A0ABU3Y299_9SPHN|nr:protein phosphatase 2C domain-containing protein [Sphingomonas sp. HF-S4]MDV3455500.1 protein phosphatase 2C domain-containing protein [Sphingomonas sp. HF-S4]
MRLGLARSQDIEAFRSVSRSHVGRVRQVNEDRVLDRPDRGLWAVADGMGGHRGGDIAAELAIAALRGVADADSPVRGEAILAALESANGQILARSEAAGGVIGSTIVALHVAEGEAQIFWAGDSRAYRARDGRWEQATRDHSLVQQLVDEGLIDREQARRHPQAHVITRALGVEGKVEVERVSFAVEPGDVLLLCSDGLSRSLGGNGTGADEQAAERLLTEALEKDGSDNITFVLVGIG